MTTPSLEDFNTARDSFQVNADNARSTVAPEPSPALLLACGFGMIVVARKRFFLGRPG
jgi:hypothetical protein